MVVLRPIAELLAEAFRDAVDIAVQGVLDTIADDFTYPVKPDEEKPRKAMTDRRSIHAVGKSRSFRKRRSAGRQAGVNGGRNVTFRD